MVQSKHIKTCSAWGCLCIFSKLRSFLLTVLPLEPDLDVPKTCLPVLLFKMTLSRPYWRLIFFFSGLLYSFFEGFLSVRRSVL